MTNIKRDKGKGLPACRVAGHMAKGKNNKGKIVGAALAAALTMVKAYHT